MAGKDSSADSLSKGAKLVIVLAILASAGFVVAALVTFMREGDWPAKYFSVAASILLILVIGLKTRSRRRRTK